MKRGGCIFRKRGGWNFDTLGQIINVDELEDDQVDENDEPLITQEKGLVSTLDSGTIESIVLFAKGLGCELTDELLLESFLYYYEHDAFLPHPDFKPLSSEEYQRKNDRDFYDCLGSEREDIRCKNKVCQRGAIKGSAFCKKHHFEMIQKKPCLFSD
ncbi:hypothetical protein ACJJIK_20925 [Microbulbifer sp. ZKSA006]|uniref:DUF7716 domain-containing protein n=1 Tax=Microbulbifer sp. ZKSA006 TaxID=3243390 RepID=UPI0040393F5D